VSDGSQYEFVARIAAKHVIFLVISGVGTTSDQAAGAIDYVVLKEFSIRVIRYDSVFFGVVR